ncbi:hypothetical protein [Bacillus cereus]|uniref:hypothetical protein n=1 Tax=Bacillus cereus TaxID=1396 RepID=UPI0014823D8F|nr:hypothetical protein [Bacillus cereus]
MDTEPLSFFLHELFLLIALLFSLRISDKEVMSNKNKKPLSVLQKEEEVVNE